MTGGFAIVHCTGYRFLREPHLPHYEKTPLDYEVIMATFLAEKIYLAFSRNTVVLTDP